MFSGRHFDRSVILLCVRWYLAYNLSLRDLEEYLYRAIDNVGDTVESSSAKIVTCWPPSDLFARR
jgi:transposase-like protein